MTAVERALTLRLLRAARVLMEHDLRALTVRGLNGDGTVASEKEALELDMVILSNAVLKLWQLSLPVQTHGQLSDAVKNAALSTSIGLYKVLSSQPDLAMTAFGLACADLIDTLGITLQAASTLLNNELTRLKIS